MFFDPRPCDRHEAEERSSTCPLGDGKSYGVKALLTGVIESLLEKRHGYLGLSSTSTCGQYRSLIHQKAKPGDGRPRACAAL